MASILNRLFGTPDQVIPMTDNEYNTTLNNGYYEPLINQVDWMNQNQGLLDETTKQQWNKAGGYNAIKNNALTGNTSGISALDNYMQNTGLEPNVIQSGLKTIPGKRGFLTDLAKGYQENYNTPFSVSNVQPDQNKGIGTRIGEGLGTLARAASSPTGRGLIAFGVTKALGGDTDQAVTQGLTAGLVNQNLRTQDQLYRQGLQEQGLDTSNIRGWITDDLYKNYSNSAYKLRDLERRELQTQATTELTRLKAEQQAIINSNLPEVQKAKLIQENAKAQYAAELQLARIEAYKNTAALGFGRLGLQQQTLDLRRQEYQDKRDAQKQKDEFINNLLNSGNGKYDGGKVF